MLLNYPLIAWTQRRINKHPLEMKIDGKIVGMQVVTLLIWVLPCALIVDAKDAANYLIPSISVLALFYGAMFSVQILINSQGFYKVALLMKLIGPIFCILMNSYKYGSNDSN